MNKLLRSTLFIMLLGMASTLFGVTISKTSYQSQGGSIGIELESYLDVGVRIINNATGQVVADGAIYSNRYNNNYGGYWVGLSANIQGVSIGGSGPQFGSTGVSFSIDNLPEGDYTIEIDVPDFGNAYSMQDYGNFYFVYTSDSYWALLETYVYIN